MRGTRWLLVLAILALLLGVGATYRIQSRSIQKDVLVVPPSISPELSGTAEDWQYGQTSQGHAVVQVRAKNLKQEKDSDHVLLEGMELHIFSKAADQYDRVKSAKADFDQKKGIMYSDGEVEITLKVPVIGQPTHQLVSIKSSGVTFESKTGKAATDRPTSFTFEHGDGKAVGAAYDPTTRELHLNSQVAINWKDAGPHSKAMKIEAGQLTYKEAAAVIWLTPWARLTRENTVLDAAGTIVNLKDGVISSVEAQKAHGVDQYPKRKLEYAADYLHADYSDAGVLQKIAGRTNARLVSSSEGSQTTMTSDMVDLNFEEQNNDAVLRKVMGYGHGVVESKPLPEPNGNVAETRVLRSDAIELDMGPGGRDIETVQTLAPGHLEFLPNQPVQRKRTLDGDSMTIKYGADNRIQSFVSTNARTETEPAAAERKNRNVSRTRSKHLTAEFEPNSSQIKRMEQWDDFSYEEGDRKAVAVRALLEQDRNIITLFGQTGAPARMWDSTGSTAADTIRLQQNTGDFAADGHVSSSRLPEKKKKTSEMLSGDEPLQALAEHMTAANHNRLIHYEGHAVLWQGADRLEAGRIDVDREKRSLTGDSAVTSQFLDDDRKDTKKKPDPLFTVVKAAHLVYTEENRLAIYTGGVLLTRPELRVKSDDLRAFLTAAKDDTEKKGDGKTGDDNSRLDKAFADGHVEIVQTMPDRTRTGTADHSEYYTDDERVVLKGGEPQLVDTVKGHTRGTELTWYFNDDRLLVAGAPDHRAASRLRRK